MTKLYAIALLALTACATGQDFETAAAPQSPLERRCKLVMSSAMMAGGHGGSFGADVAAGQAAYANCMAGHPVAVVQPVKKTKLTCTKDAISIEPTVTCVD